jgi:hypothetical protein
MTYDEWIEKVAEEHDLSEGTEIRARALYAKGLGVPEAVNVLREEELATMKVTSCKMSADQILRAMTWTIKSIKKEFPKMDDTDVQLELLRAGYTANEVLWCFAAAMERASEPDKVGPNGSR